MDGEATDFIHMEIHKQTDLHFSELFLTHAESKSLKTGKKRK